MDGKSIFSLAVFFWTNVMAWDIYKTFGQRTILSHIRPTGEDNHNGSHQLFESIKDYRCHHLDSGNLHFWESKVECFV